MHSHSHDSVQEVGSHHKIKRFAGYSLAALIAFYGLSSMITLSDALADGFISLASFLWLFANSSILLGMMLAFMPAFLIELGVVYREVPAALDILFVVGPVRHLIRNIAQRELKKYFAKLGFSKEELAKLQLSAQTKDAFIKALQQKNRKSSKGGSKQSKNGKPELHTFKVGDKKYQLSKILNAFTAEEIKKAQKEMRNKSRAMKVVVFVTAITLVAMTAIIFASFVESAIKIFLGTTAISWVIPTSIFIGGLAFGVLAGLATSFLVYRNLSDSIEKNTPKKWWNSFKAQRKEASQIKDKNKQRKAYAKLALKIVAFSALSALTLYVAIASGMAVLQGTHLFLAYLSGSSLTTPTLAIKIISDIIVGVSISVFVWFSISKGVDSYVLMREQLNDAPKAFNSAKQKMKAQMKKESILQFINPFRAISLLIQSVGTMSLLLIHIVSESFLAGKGAGLSSKSSAAVTAETVAISTSSANHFLIDLPYIKMKEDKNTVIEVAIFTLTLFPNLLAVAWDAASSKQHSVSASWDKFFKQKAPQKEKVESNAKKDESSTAKMLKDKLPAGKMQRKIAEEVKQHFASPIAAPKASATKSLKAWSIIPRLDRSSHRPAA